MGFDSDTAIVFLQVGQAPGLVEISGSSGRQKRPVNQKGNAPTKAKTFGRFIGALSLDWPCGWWDWPYESCESGRTVRYGSHDQLADSLPS